MVIPVQAFLPNVVAELIRKSPLSPEKVQFAWSAAVGSSVDRASSVMLEDGVLHVRVRDAAWRREIIRSARLIRGRLDSFLGPDVVRTLKITIGQ